LKTSYLPMIGIFVAFIGVFYFMSIRPQQKRYKAQQEMMASLTKGDIVMTASGIYGKIKRVEDTVVVMEVAKGVTMKVLRRAITDIIRDSEKAKLLAPEGTTTSSARTSRASKDSTVEDSSSESDIETDEIGADK
jgi:preprotein translocase subunit YajC